MGGSCWLGEEVGLPNTGRSRRVEAIYPRPTSALRQSPAEAEALLRGLATREVHRLAYASREDELNTHRGDSILGPDRPPVGLASEGPLAELGLPCFEVPSPVFPICDSPSRGATLLEGSSRKLPRRTPGRPHEP